MARLHLLLDGFFVCDKTIFLPEGEHVKYEAAAKSLLIISEKEKILVDTGIGDLPDKPGYKELRKTLSIRRGRGQGIKAQLAKCGLRPDQITTVVNTHLHAAHAGNNNLFKDAKFYIAGEELKFIDRMVTEDPNQKSYIQEKFDKVRDVERVRGVYKLTDGVTIFPTPGHTLGHQSVIIKQNGSSLVYSGDVSPLRENVVNRIPMSSFDRKMNLESMKKLLQIGNARWIFTHDSDQLTLKQAYKPA